MEQKENKKKKKLKLRIHVGSCRFYIFSEQIHKHFLSSKLKQIAVITLSNKNNALPLNCFT